MQTSIKGNKIHHEFIHLGYCKCKNAHLHTTHTHIRVQKSHKAMYQLSSPVAEEGAPPREEPWGRGPRHGAVDAEPAGGTVLLVGGASIARPHGGRGGGWPLGVEGRDGHLAAGGPGGGWGRRETG